MEHSITFIRPYSTATYEIGGTHTWPEERKNTWSDWYLIPKEPLKVAFPDVKSRTISIPGSDITYDFTDTNRGFPFFERRTGSWEFIIANDWYAGSVGYTSRKSIYESIINFLHGKKLKVILSDEPAYFYEGRITVNSLSSDPHFSSISLDYDLDPYKKSIYRTTSNEWAWDSFDFTNGYTQNANFRSIPITTTKTRYTFYEDDYGRAPVSPTLVISASSTVNVWFQNQFDSPAILRSLSRGSHNIPEFIFAGSYTYVWLQSVSGSGTITFDFVRGYL